MSQQQETTFTEEEELEHLYQLLQNGKEDEFVQADNIAKYANHTIREQTLLHRAAIKRLPQAVKKLLCEGARQIRTSRYPCLPVEIAGKRGYHRVFEIFLNDSPDKVPDRLLVELLKHADEKIPHEDVDHNKCVDIWFQKCHDIDVNVQDEKTKNTPLHYAARYAKPERIEELLMRGASLVSQNIYEEQPIEDIDADLLENHFNACLSWKTEGEEVEEEEDENRTDKEEFIVTFNCKTLVPLKKIEVEDFSENADDLEAGNLTPKRIKQVASEIEVISCMSELSELKHLLKHPLITSFLFMKWYRIRWFFYINFTFYIAFCLSLIFYILLMYINHYNNQHKIVAFTLSLLLSITFTILVVREFLQFVISPKKYFLNFENWLELTLIIFTAVILFYKSPSENLRKQVSAGAILLAAFELVLLIGQHPMMSTNIAMLRTVSVNFFKSLLWYFILILAFSLSFYTLFKTNSNAEDGKVKNATTEGEKQDFFVNPLMALFKTTVMLTGEFDSGSINFHAYPVTSHVIFMLFVFMVAVILLNLLNGLAVSDTQRIKSNAEVVGHTARIKHIAYIESMLVGHIMPRSILKIIRKCCRCLKLNIMKNFSLSDVLVRRICLFPHFLQNYELEVYLNQRANVILPRSKDVNIYLDKQTAKRTKHLMKAKEQMLEKEKIKQRFLEKQKQQQKYIEKLREEQQVILDKLNYIILKCT